MARSSTALHEPVPASGPPAGRRPLAPVRRLAGHGTDRVTDLCTALFAGFRGYDQRIRARQYMDGLLTAEGRKSIANIATSVGTPGDEQRLHHFVNSARWSVGPVRRALTAFLDGTSPSAAWVALPVSIPKTGSRTVGVAPHYSAEDGHRVVGQRAYGMWYASEHLVAPVSWRLALPGDSGRAPSTTRECVAGLLDDVRTWQGGSSLCVTDVRGDGEQEDVARLLCGASPVAVRVSGHTLLAVDERQPGGRKERLVPVRDALGAARRTRHMDGVPYAGHGGLPPVTATAHVRLPGAYGAAAGGSPGRVTLFGMWRGTRRVPDEWWLTNARDASPAALLRASRLMREVGAGWRDRGRNVGLRDFEGRSLQGWHRHVTLASCAYAVAELASSEAPGNASRAA
ncbi:IS701 family transposase [Streptomyces sp. NPDC002640]